MSDHVLVTRIRRSGTTFVGEVLTKSNGLFYLHEPLNRDWGIEGVEYWFPYVYDEESQCADLINQFMEGEVSD